MLRTILAWAVAALAASVLVLGTTQAGATVGTQLVITPPTGATSASGLMYSTPACPPGFPGSAVVRVIDPAGAPPENISPVNNSVTAPFSGTLSDTFAELVGQFPAMRGNTTELAVYCFALAGGNGSAVAAEETFVTISAVGVSGELVIA